MAMSDAAYQQIVDELKASRAHKGQDNPYRQALWLTGFVSQMGAVAMVLGSNRRFRKDADFSAAAERGERLFQRARALSFEQATKELNDAGWPDAKPLVHMANHLPPAAYTTWLDQVEPAIVRAEQRPRDLA
jgi:hypothetical protein